MERNHLQPNPNYNAAFIPNPAPNVGQQQAQAQQDPVPPLANAPGLHAHLPARNLQAYNAIHTPQGWVDSWNWQEYQPIKPEELGIEKLADEAANSKKVDRFLKHAQECEADGDLQDAEKNYKKALKYTDSAEHYKLYASCLQKISASLKDATKASVYREKAARAFYYLGELYAKQRSWNPAQAAYKASCELALYEVPLQALVDVARQLEDTAEIANALEKLADFYAGKGDTASAIQMLEEALQVEKSSTILEKLAALHGQVGGEDSQLKVNETRIHQFELQLSQDPKNIGLYRKYVWFLKDIGRKSEARAVKERMDGLSQAMQRELFQDLQQNFQTLEQKLVKQKIKIGGLKQTIHLKDEKLEVLEKQLQGSTTGTNIAINDLKKEQANSIRTLNIKLNKLDSLNTQFEALSKQVQTNTSKNDTAIEGLEKRLVSLEKLKISQQVRNLQTDLSSLNTDLNGRVDALSEQVVSKNATIHRMRQQVTTLNFIGKSSMTDQELINELDENPQVEILNLQGCTNLTNNALRVIPDKCKKLRELNLTGCTGRIEDGVIHVLDHALQLKLVNFTGSPLVSSPRIYGERPRMHYHAKGISFVGGYI